MTRPLGCIEMPGETSHLAARYASRVALSWLCPFCVTALPRNVSYSSVFTNGATLVVLLYLATVPEMEDIMRLRGQPQIISGLIR